MANELQTGVYCITNRVSGRKYVGSASRSLKDRIARHIRALRRGKHDNPHLQAAWRKYGEASFDFTVLQRCAADDCLRCEQEFIDRLECCNRTKGYNICPMAGSTRGFSPTQLTRKKLSAANRARFTDPAQREKQSLAQRGKSKSPSARANIGNAIRLRCTTNKFRDQRRETANRSWADPEIRARRVAATKKALTDPETWARVRATKSTPEVRAKLSAANKRNMTEQRLNWLRTHFKGRRHTPETIAKMSAARKARWEQGAYDHLGK